MEAQPMNRQQIALHSLQAEFMREAEPGEWHVLPGGRHEGCRIPDMEDDRGNVFIGCWLSRPIDGLTTEQQEQEWRDAEEWCRKGSNLVLFFGVWISFCAVAFGFLFAVVLGYGPGVFLAVAGVLGLGAVAEGMRR